MFRISCAPNLEIPGYATAFGLHISTIFIMLNMCSSVQPYLLFVSRTFVIRYFLFVDTRFM